MLVHALKLGELLSQIHVLFFFIFKGWIFIENLLWHFSFKSLNLLIQLDNLLGQSRAFLELLYKVFFLLC